MEWYQKILFLESSALAYFLLLVLSMGLFDLFHQRIGSIFYSIFIYFSGFSRISHFQEKLLKLSEMLFFSVYDRLNKSRYSFVLSNAQKTFCIN